MANKQDIRQSVLHSNLSMAGYTAGANLDTLFPLIDAEMAKLFEDRNVMLTDGGTITFTGTQVQFTENLNITLNQKISGAVPQVISLGSSSQNFTNSGDMMVAVINRTTGAATVSIVASGSALPAVTSANQEVFLIAKRIDAGDGTQRLYFRNGSAFNAGQTARLGSAGSGGSGSGIGDDLDSLQFQASFSDLFTESASNSNSSINATSPNTNATFSAAKAMYVINYDASKTVTTSGTTATLSATPAYTVAAGDVVVSGGYARKIITVNTQTSYVLEAAFPSNLASAACCVSQAVITKDIYNLSVDGVALQTEFGSTTFSEIMVDYKDNATSNSNIFTPNVTPKVSYVASNDNTNFTNVNTRPSSTTTSVPSVILPSAGTSLYLRFFASASSGSGFANLITYKAFMQKSVTAAGTNNVLWSASGTTNSSTTPLNCTVSVVGGKTTIQIANNTYPVNANPGTTVGALSVYVNGQLMDRFVSGTTPATSGYYTEVDQRTIQLDRDYSSQQWDFTIIYSLQVIDSSTANTTNISSLQSALGQNITNFVNTSNVLSATTTTGTPASGTFYSQITNRAPLVDPSQDMKPRMGVTRHMTQMVYRIQTEFGPNGESVWGVPNDTFGEVRLFGQWNYQQEGLAAGMYVFSNAAGDTVEITFYGTGLNVLAFLDNTARNWAVQVDGGGYGSNLSQTVSAVQQSQNYSPNNVVNVASGLTLGVHTVSIKSTSGFAMYGYEVLTEQSQIKVNPGSAFVSGTKLTLASQSSLAYNSGFTSGTLGTRGGRVLVYQSSTGAVATAVQPVNATAASFNYAGTGYSGGVADHTNEEVVRVISWREFAAARFSAGDDFSTVVTSSTSRRFTLDDDSTTLVGSGILQSVSNADAMAFATTGNFAELTFIGTGVDIVNSRGATITDVYNISIDGTNVVSAVSGATLFGGGTMNVVKIVSGLPYGSHTLRITVSTSNGVGVNIPQFIIYQPKTPTLPSGAISLGAYNVLANFSSASSAGTFAMSQGVIRKNIIREAIFTGTWTANATNVNNIGGFTITSSTTGDKVSFTFFGTGFDFRLASTTTSYTATMSIDGSSNFGVSNGSYWSGALTTSFYGSGLTSFASGTGLITTSTTSIGGNGCVVQGLNLGIHTVTVTKNATGATTFVPEAFDIITPIHSYKIPAPAGLNNELLIGSQAIQDTRAFAALAVPVLNTKAWGMAFGINSSPTTAATADVPMPDMIVVVKTNGGPVKISYSVFITATTGTQNVTPYIDGQAANVGQQQFTTASSGSGAATSCVMTVLLSPGVHVIQLFWRTSAGTATATGSTRTLTVEEL